MRKDDQTTSRATEHRREGRYVKCIVWDLDHTLWRGILSENDELALRDDLVDVIKTLDKRGILHSIASRNDDDLAREQLKRFGILEYFLFPQISWGPKSEAIRTIAKKLNLGLDSFAFVDDQAFERAEVAHHLPEVLCIPVEDADQLPNFPPFQPRFLTADSRLRRTMYMDDQQRTTAEQEFHGTDEEFLASLNMVLTIGPAQESDLQRAEELTVRTHQLNSTGRCYSYEELTELIKDPRFKVLVAGLEDRFGPYGRIGLAVVECQETAWIIKLVLMSCRVVSRGVGGVMLTHLKQLASQAGVRLLAEFVPTPRNRIMYVALKFNGFQEIQKTDQLTLLENAASDCPSLPSFLTVNIHGGHDEIDSAGAIQAAAPDPGHAANSTEPEPRSIPPFTNFVECMRYWAGQRPAKTAFWYTEGTEADEQISYEQVDRKARAVATRLAEMGATGKRVLLLFPPGLEFASAFYGCLYAGAVAVPAYPPRRNRKAQRIHAICQDAEARCALTVQKYADQFDELGLAGLGCVATDSLPADLADGWQMPDLDRETLAVLQYTSGSTGVPKGVMLTHGNLIHNCEAILQGFGIGQDGVGLIWLPTFHDMGLVGGVLKPVYSGLSNVLMSPMAFLQKPIRWLQKITQYQVTISGGPNFAYELCIQKIDTDQCEGLDLSSWEVAFNGAEPIRPETLEQFTHKFAPYGFRPQMHYPCYGMAETTLIVTGAAKADEPLVRAFDRSALEKHRALPAADNDAAAARLVSCGHPMPRMKIRIVDPDSLQPLPDSAVGEIWIAGPSVGQGYWHKPEDTERCFRAVLDGEDERYLRTGDLGFLQDGHLFVSGRLKDLLIIRGRNLYPQDIERTVERAHRALRVDACAVFSAGSNGSDKLVIAQEVARNCRKEQLDDVLDAIREAVLEEHDVAAETVVLLRPGKLPKTSSGKVARNECREEFLEGKLEVVRESGRAVSGEIQTVTSPDTPVSSLNADSIQAWLVSQLSRHLRLDPSQVDVHESFAHFGLDSAMLVGISGDLQSWLGTPISPTVLYSYPTIASLADHLGALLDPDPQQETVSSADDDKAPAETTTEPIAIVGIGCRFPQADSPSAFWSLLENGVDVIREIGSDRWDVASFFSPDPDAPGKTYCRHAGLLDDIDQFDPQFFGIAPREAAGVDPQQRLLLEVAWEALEHAGESPDRLASNRVGVFVGMSNCEYERLQSRCGNLEAIDVHTGTGSLNSVAAGRLAYVLGLHGPCMVVDTACSSSLLSIHLAVKSLRDQECRAALAGGVNVVLDPASMVAMCKLRALTHDTHCKTFDNDADGYVRGEGCGMVLLKRLSDAVADGDRVLGVIHGTAVNHDGHSNGLTAPHGPSQEAVIREALVDARIEPAQVSYLEAHGAATALGDPIEVRAAAAVYAKGRSPDTPLAIGSVKTNLGHLEAAAGIAGLIKVVLALQHGEIPPHLHLRKPNAYIPWDQLPITVPTQRTPWPTVDGRRVAGISSFGLSGTNVHVIVEGHGDEQAPTPLEHRDAQQRPLHLMSLSAANERALQMLAGRYQAAVEDPNCCLPDLCYTVNTGRAGLVHRAAVIADGVEQAQTRLEAISLGLAGDGIVRGTYDGQRAPRIAFLFTGEGAQFVGMGRQLFETQPTFRRALEHCDQVLLGELERPLLEVIYPKDGDSSRLREATYALPALFALQHALCELWKSWGVEPAIVLGQSFAEYVAACHCGVMHPDDALRLIARYGRILGRLPVQHVVDSRDVEPLREQFSSLWAGLPLSKPCRPIVSSLDGQPVGEAIASDEYWRQQLGAASRLEQAIDALAKSGADVLLEIGPAPLPIGEGQAHPVLASLREGQDDCSTMLHSLAQLFVRGAPVDWRGFDRDYTRRKVTAPSYPFQRRRHWVELPPPDSSLAAAARQAPHTPPAELKPDWYYEVQWHPRSRWAQPVLRPAPAALVNPLQVAQRVQPEIERLLNQLSLPRYQDFGLEMNRLAAGYAKQALRQLGWSADPNQSVTVAQLATQLGIQTAHQRLLRQMLVILEEDGLLVRDPDGGWNVGQQSITKLDPELMWANLSNRFPECKAELALVRQCGAQLADVLTGVVDPLQVLFPDGSGEMVESLYKDSPFARTLNTLVEEAIMHSIGKLSAGRNVKILEIGAGTGSTTSHILPRLAPQRTEYLFTDVSEVFTHAARAKFRDYPFLRFGTLDIESPPRQQGYADHRFDLILASNVFHATKDIRQTVAHTRQLLAPGGSLVLLEGTRPQHWMDLVFGLTEGWWRYEDTDLRPAHPMLSAQQWIDLLSASEFGQVVSLPPTDSRPGNDLPPYAVVVAQADHSCQPATTTQPQTEPAQATSVWLILSDAAGVGQQASDILRAQGEACVLVEAGDGYDQVHEDHYIANPSSKADLRQIIKQVAARQTTVLRGVAHLWSLDAPNADEMTLEGLASAQRFGCISAAALLQELHAAELAEPPRVWFVTRGAQSVAERDRTPSGKGSDPFSKAAVTGLSQSPLWGLGRVVAEESPPHWGGLLDLDPDASVTTSAQLMVDELMHPDAEDQLAYRGEQRFAARLVRRSATPAGAALPWRPDASYLISGGLGELGLTVAQWMADQGARNLVLFGRSDFPPRADWKQAAADDARRAAQIGALRQLEAAGASIHVASADAADPHQLSALLHQLRNEGWPPVRGVVHCAGVAEAVPLFELTEQQLEQTLRPKVLGTWLLHQLLENERLDFFVSFSSGASLLGSPLLGSYAAANAFLDAMAHYRRSKGLPALSINWGFWAQAGMVARSQREIGWGFAPQGMQSYEPDQGLAAMRQLLLENATQASVMPVDWPQWRGFHPRASRSPLLANLMLTETAAGEEAGTETPGAVIDRDELLAAPPAERRQLLQNYLTGQLSRVLRTPAEDLDVELPMRYLGIDSLMAVELRNRIHTDLHVTIPVAQLLREPTISRVAKLLQDELQADARSDVTTPLNAAGDDGIPPVTPPTVDSGQESAVDALANLTDLTDDEVSAMLNRMLDSQNNEDTETL